MAQEESMQKYTEHMYKEECPMKEYLALDWEVKCKERSKEEGRQEKRKVGKGVMKESCHE